MLPGIFSFVRFEVLKVMILTLQLFCDVMIFLTGKQLVTLQRIIEGTLLGLLNHEDKGTTILQHVINCLPIAKV